MQCLYRKLTRIKIILMYIGKLPWNTLEYNNIILKFIVYNPFFQDLERLTLDSSVKAGSAKGVSTTVSSRKVPEPASYSRPSHSSVSRVPVSDFNRSVLV